MASGQLAADAMLLGPGMTDWQPAYPQQQAAQSADIVTAAPIASYQPQRQIRPSPEYFGIRLGAGVLMIFGFLSFVFGVIAAFAAFAAAKSSGGESAFGMAGAIAAVNLIVAGIFLMFCGSLGYAIRDIARNSFRW